MRLIQEPTVQRAVLELHRDHRALCVMQKDDRQAHAVRSRHRHTVLFYMEVRGPYEDLLLTGLKVGRTFSSSNSFHHLNQDIHVQMLNKDVCPREIEERGEKNV